MQANQRKLLFLSSLGGILEFYDFVIYALFASYIANAFFPTTNPITSLMVTFASFAIGYLARPVGGIIFGHFGDRIGRKATFTISIFMMAMATIAIGLVPSYATIGITAPILVIALRIIQGFSLGGEIPGAITYVSESIPKKKGLACGIIFCALNLGTVLGSLAETASVSIFNDADMQAFGWRIPFVFGGILGLLSFLLRRNLHESPQFLAIENKIEHYPIVAVCKQQFATILATAFIVAICASIVTSLILFIPAYFSKVLHIPAADYIWERTGSVALGAMLCIPFGYLTDKINKSALLFILIMSTAVFAYPIFFIFAYLPGFYLQAFLMCGILIGFSAGIIPSFISDIFSANVRYSGIAVSYNIGFAIFGGLAPFMSLSLIYYTDSIVAPALYLVCVSLLAFIGLMYLYYFRSK